MNVSMQNVLAGSASRHLTTQASRVTPLKMASKSSEPAAAVGADFQKVLQSTAAVATPVIATTNPVSLLTLFSGGISQPAQQRIADPAPMPTAHYTALPATQQALANQAWDPFNPAQHEARMNQWYMQTTQTSNQQTLTQYQHGVTDWKENVARCQDLGMAPPPPPTVPVLQAVGPMPDGYWFGKTSQG